MARGSGIGCILLLCASSAFAGEYPTAEELFGCHELAQGGRPFFAEFFGQGWPTDATHRELTDQASQTANLLLAAYLGSGNGFSLGHSDYMTARHAAAIKRGEQYPNPKAQVQDDLRVYKHLANFRGPTDGLLPVFLPFSQSKEDLLKPWDEGVPQTWRRQLKADTGEHDLESFGFALLAEVNFATEQLQRKRVEEQAGRDVELLGNTPLEGLVALTALSSAAAKVWELRHQLVLDINKQAIVPSANLVRLDPRRFHFPGRWRSRYDGVRLIHEPLETGGKKDLRSTLAGQAAVLLGASRLAALCGPDAPEPAQELFKTMAVSGRQVDLFPPDIGDIAREVALFAFQSIRTLHVAVAGKARPCSIVNKGTRGGTITPKDQGLFLLGIEAFLSDVHFPPKSKGPAVALLEDEQGKARTLMRSLGGTINVWHKNSPGGFYDKYDVISDSRALRTRSLQSQALAIRGLLATHRVLAEGARESEFLNTSVAAYRWLDGERWDDLAQAYLEEGKPRRTTMAGAVSVLAALRELALETGDGRYLMRYAQFLATLRDKGFLKQPSGRTPPGLSAQLEFPLMDDKPK